ncbi:phenylacetate--CoA ligase family protein [Desulfatibacillum aliphaticivorans]|uniref:phenylacetate--CoA ligase family protein n=1 Tax=Desulfatibacillum aliphaticivorans TaxID=218208 RepID=UPI00041937F8|nr:AMP-binding protein [Desulfatibacillum aliphaticivorans]
MAVPGFPENLDPQQRSQHQLERLQETLNRAYRSVPFYQAAFKEKNIDPLDVGGLEDLAKLPFTERRHLAENYPYGLFAVPLRDIVRIHTAPGEGQAPSVSGYTAQDLDLWRGLVARALMAAGVNANDIMQIFLDPGLASWGRGYKDGAEELEASVIPLTALPLEKQQMVLKDYKTSVVVTTPSSAEELCQGLYAEGIKFNELALKTLIFAGEPISQEDRDVIAGKLHVDTWVHYGLSEVPGPAIAFECKAHEGLHVSEDHFYPEIINPSTGEPAAPGEEGELVLTTLTTRAFPLIRFRTGDRVSYIQEPCSCGRTLCRINWHQERTDNIVVIKGVKVHHAQVMAHISKALGFTPTCCRLLAGKKGDRVGLEVWLGMDDTIFSDEIKELEKVVDNVENALIQELGITARVRLAEGEVDCAEPGRREVAP